MNVIQKTIPLSDGREITLETGKLAKQADGSVVVRMGNTMLLATVVSAKEAKEDVDFMPLSVDYKEKFAAAGRFPGGFLRREGRPGDNEILVSRLVDRALRPLFPDDYHADTFVSIELISADPDNVPDALAGLAASAAIAVSDIPFNGPISECRVARINGEFKTNPTREEIAIADMDMMIGATIDNILMVEGEMNEVSEEEMIEAIAFAHEEIKKQCKAQMELAEEVGSTVKREYCHETNDEELRKKVWDATYDKAYDVAKQTIADKHKRSELFSAVKEEFLSQYSEEDEVNKTLVGRYYHDVEKEAVRNFVLDTKTRIDGRKTDEIRPIWSEVDYLPSAHGSAVFTRGETQSLTTVTLGTKLDDKIIDEVTRQGKDKFLLHYNFPPYCTGDARPSRGTSRREVGHGNLAHRALKRVLPSDGFPYSIRLVSDILESNGSSSMATVCAGTLALMDAGVSISKPVSGIAMGLITDAKERYAILSDILGDEDHLGEMDFKVDGLSFEVLKNALEQAKAGRLHILDKIEETMQAPRPEVKPHAPHIEMITIPTDSIGALIGPGGKVVQEIQKQTNTTIVIEERENKGFVEVVASDLNAINDAMNRIKEAIGILEVGATFKGKVKSIQTYGAFVEITPSKDGLLHISEIDWNRIRKVEDVLEVGQEIEVKLLSIDDNGKLKLSRKALLPKPTKS